MWLLRVVRTCVYGCPMNSTIKIFDKTIHCPNILYCSFLKIFCQYLWFIKKLSLFRELTISSRTGLTNERKPQTANCFIFCRIGRIQTWTRRGKYHKYLSKIKVKNFRIIMKTTMTMELSLEDSVESIRTSPLIFRIQSADAISRSEMKLEHSKI